MISIIEKTSEIVKESLDDMETIVFQHSIDENDLKNVNIELQQLEKLLSIHADPQFSIRKDRLWKMIYLFTDKSQLKQKLHNTEMKVQQLETRVRECEKKIKDLEESVKLVDEDTYTESNQTVPQCIIDLQNVPKHRRENLIPASRKKITFTDFMQDKTGWFEVGEVVLYNKKLYRCIYIYTFSGKSVAPDSDLLHWRILDGVEKQPDNVWIWK